MRKSGIILAVVLSSFCLQAQSLRVMTFNVRYPAPGDGENKWESRRDLLVETVHEKAPDVMGTQELFYEQGQYIVEKATEYRWFGVSRRGDRTDEHMGVFYKTSALMLVESGNFWLSETPEKPGSMSWDVSLPRMVTWGLFEMKAGGRRFYLYNTHFPHRRNDEQARIECARMIRDRLAKLPADMPAILIGDFNAPMKGDVYRVLAPGLTDVWETAASKTGPEGTFNGFKGAANGPRIDWMFFRGSLRAVRVETVTKNEGGRYPSDHFPVVADLSF